MADMNDLFSDAQAWADAAAREARMDGDETPNVKLLMKRLGVGLIQCQRHHIIGGGLGQTGIVDGRDVVRYRRGLSPSQETFVLGHELGHVLVKRWRLRLELGTEEAWCHAFSAALRVPAAPLRRAWGRGHDVNDIVERWPSLSPTSMMMRLGETGIAPVYIFQRGRHRYARAPQPPPADATELAAEAMQVGRAFGPGIIACRLPEHARRAAVVLTA